MGTPNPYSALNPNLLATRSLWGPAKPIPPSARRRNSLKKRKILKSLDYDVNEMKKIVGINNPPKHNG